MDDFIAEERDAHFAKQLFHHGCPTQRQQWRPESNHVRVAKMLIGIDQQFVFSIFRADVERRGFGRPRALDAPFVELGGEGNIRNPLLNFA